MLNAFSRLGRAGVTPVIAILLALFLCAQAQASNITGTFTTPNTSVPLANATVRFDLNQAAIVPGSYSIVTTPVTCYTSVDGSIKGLPNPLVIPVTAVNLTTGSIAAGTYYVRLTYTGSGVETLPSPSAGVSLSGTGKITVNAPFLQPSNATGYKVYVGTVDGSEHLQATTVGWGNTAVTSYNSGSAAAPSTNNSVCSLQFNDAMIPAPTTYRVSVVDVNAAPVSGFPQQWYLAGGSFDVSNGYPVANNVQTKFPQPIIANPSSNALQSVNSPLTFNGYDVKSGALVNTGLGSHSLSAAGQGIIYFDIGCECFMGSMNGGAFSALNFAGGPGGAVLLNPGINDQNIQSNINPQTDATWDLGTTALRWRDVHASRDVYAGADFRIGSGLEAITTAATTVFYGDSYTGTGHWTDLKFLPGTSSYQLGIDKGGTYWPHVDTTPTCTSGLGRIYFDGTHFQVCEGTSGPTAMLSGGGGGGSNGWQYSSPLISEITSTDTVQIGSYPSQDLATWNGAQFRVGQTIPSSDGSKFTNTLQTTLTSAMPGATTNYERGALIVYTGTADPSTYSGSACVVCADAVPIDARGIIATGNMTGRAWGAYLEPSIQSGGDGNLTGLEISVVNNGSDQTAMDTVTSKNGITIESAGSNISSAAISIFSAGNLWARGLLGRQDAFITGGSFLELYKSGTHTDLFRVSELGQMLVGDMTNQANTGTYNASIYGQATFRNAITVADNRTDATGQKNFLYITTDNSTSKERIIAANYDSGTTPFPMTFETTVSGSTTRQEVMKLTLEPFVQFTTSYNGSNKSASGTFAIRNNAGTMEVSQNAGSWVAFGAGGGGTLGGSGTANKVAKFSDATDVGNSNITDDGTTITHGSNTLIDKTSASASSPSFTLGFKVTDSGSAAKTINQEATADGSAHYFIHWKDNGGTEFAAIRSDGIMTLPVASSSLTIGASTDIVFTSNTSVLAAFARSTNGDTIAKVQNVNSGNAARAIFSVVSDGSGTVNFAANSSTYAGAGGAASQGVIGTASLSAGLLLTTSAGDIIFAAGSTTADVTVKADGALLFATSSAATGAGKFRYNGTNFQIDNGSGYQNVLTGTSGIGGAGTASRIPKWQDASNLTDSVMFDDGTTVLLGATSSTSADYAIEGVRSRTNGNLIAIRNSNTSGSSAYAGLVARVGTTPLDLTAGVSSASFTPSNGIGASTGFILTGSDATNGMVITTAAGGIDFDPQTSLAFRLTSVGQALFGLTSYPVSVSAAQLIAKNSVTASAAASSASTISILVNTGNSTTVLNSGRSDTGGTYLPLVFNVNNAERMRIATTGDVSVGSATDNGFKFEVTGTMNVTSTLTATFSGNGASITSLNAGNISSGTLAIARGGTNAGSQTGNGINFFNGSSITSSSNLTYNGTNVTVTGGSFLIGTTGNGFGNGSHSMVVAAGGLEFYASGAQQANIVNAGSSTSVAPLYLNYGGGINQIHYRACTADSASHVCLTID